MFETGIVVELDGNLAVVEFERSAACAGCKACMVAGDKAMRVTVNNSLNAEIGDRVSVEMPTKSFIGATLIAYILPLAAFLAALIVTYAVTRKDALSAVIGLGAAGLVYVLLRTLEPRFKRSGKFAPAMVRIVKKSNEKSVL